jgi:sigma-B regulation protein RsbQ
VGSVMVPDRDPVAVLSRHCVTRRGRPGGPVLLFAHGFGCDQHMWSRVEPSFRDEFETVTFDYLGAGASDVSAYSADRYAGLEGYAADVIAICEAAELRDVTLVGHSVSAMVAVIASVQRPDLFSRLVLVGPSPRYTDSDGYIGGFSTGDIDDMLDALSSNYLGWSAALAPVIVGNPDRPELGQELTETFCRMDPEIARQFARATFLSDHRHVLPHVTVPTLVLQCRDDVIAPQAVGEFVRDAIPDATYELLDATGHCPNLSHPDQTTAAIRRFLNG